MNNNLRGIYDSRYFWMHLVRIDLKNKFRRSKLGILWTFISPLCLTCIMSVVFAVAFHSNIAEYAPYILSGLLFWDVMNNSVQAGAGSIVANAPYIQQFNHPITIYTLKSALVNVISFMIAMIALAIWMMFVNPVNVLIGILSLPLTLIVYFGLSWALTTTTSYIYTKYRDYPQMAVLIMQTIWYLSPVFFQEEMFASVNVLYTWYRVNPITHFLFLIRKPFLEGCFAAGISYAYCIGFVLALGALAVYVDKKSRDNVIFYI